MDGPSNIAIHLSHRLPYFFRTPHSQRSGDDKHLNHSDSMSKMAWDLVIAAAPAFCPTPCNWISLRADQLRLCAAG
jgi:hypothetical protein